MAEITKDVLGTDETLRHIMVLKHVKNKLCDLKSSLGILQDTVEDEIVIYIEKSLKDIPCA